MWMRQTEYQLELKPSINGKAFLFYSRGLSDLPQEVSRDGYEVFTGNGTSEGVLEEFQRVVMNNQWGELQNIQVTGKLLEFLVKNKVKVALFSFIPDFNSSGRSKHSFRWDLMIRLDFGKHTTSELKKLVVRGLKESGGEVGQLRIC